MMIQSHIRATFHKLPFMNLTSFQVFFFDDIDDDADYDDDEYRAKPLGTCKDVL